jgi:SAM-dependent methyltransferase
MNTSRPAPNAMSHTEDFEFEALNDARNYRRALLREFGPYLKGSVLEVGAGIGQITEELRALSSITTLCAIEPNATFCERIRARFPDQKLVHGTIADINDLDGLNTILSVNVLEHIEDDKVELRRYCQLLKGTQGSLCLFVPARPEIYAPIDRDFGHFRRYTRTSLRSDLEAAGFAIDRIRYFNFIGYFAWWLYFCVLKKRSFERDAVRFFDRAVFPITNWSETTISAPPIGQSLLAVARPR